MSPIFQSFKKIIVRIRRIIGDIRQSVKIFEAAASRYDTYLVLSALSSYYSLLQPRM